MTDDSQHFFEVKLDTFDGPIDLLLHLVKRNELPIEKLSLYQITAQYFDCLENMKHLDLEVAGEYLVIAATLLSIKASILLNEPVELVADEDGQMVDPHLLLLERLREAAIYKDGAMALSGRNLLGLDVFENIAVFNEIEPIAAPLKDHDPMLLAKAFKKLIERRKDQIPKLTFSVDSISIVDRMMGILERLSKSDKPLSFDMLVDDITDRGNIISGFLALLELAKRGAVYVTQLEVFDEIVIGLASSEEKIFDQTNFQSSEFDEVSVNE